VGRLFRHHQQHRFALRAYRGRLFLAHQAGLFAEDLAGAERGQHILVVAVVDHDAHLPLAHHIQAAVVARTLLQDFLAGADALDADAAHEFFELGFADLAAQVEQARHQAAGRG
jgi:hypothetical protein